MLADVGKITSGKQPLCRKNRRHVTVRSGKTHINPPTASCVPLGVARLQANSGSVL